MHVNSVIRITNPTDKCCSSEGHQMKVPLKEALNCLPFPEVLEDPFHRYDLTFEPSGLANSPRGSMLRLFGDQHSPLIIKG
ncbi:hypothetical protein ACTXT7_011845 [Hymenolepis weldensis]